MSGGGSLFGQVAGSCAIATSSVRAMHGRIPFSDGKGRNGNMYNCRGTRGRTACLAGDIGRFASFALNGQLLKDIQYSSIVLSTPPVYQSGPEKRDTHMLLGLYRPLMFGLDLFALSPHTPFQRVLIGLHLSLVSCLHH